MSTARRTSGTSSGRLEEGRIDRDSSSARSLRGASPVETASAKTPTASVTAVCAPPRQSNAGAASFLDRAGRFLSAAVPLESRFPSVYRSRPSGRWPERIDGMHTSIEAGAMIAIRPSDLMPRRRLGLIPPSRRAARRLPLTLLRGSARLPSLGLAPRWRRGNCSGRECSDETVRHDAVGPFFVGRAWVRLVSSGPGDVLPDALCEPLHTGRGRDAQHVLYPRRPAAIGTSRICTRSCAGAILEG